MKNIFNTEGRNTPVFRNLSYDRVFKDIFGNPMHKELLIRLLNTIIKSDNPIEDLVYLPQESNTVSPENKKSVCDVRCKLASGEHIIIEVQMNYELRFDERIIYEACTDIATQIDKSSDRHDKVYTLEPVYVISIVHFPRRHRISDAEKHGNIVWEYDINNPDTGEKLGNILHFIFVELGDFKKNVSDLGTFEEKVYFCLKSIGTLDSKPEEFSDDFFEKLFKITAFDSLEKDQKDEYLRIMNSEEKRLRQIAGALEQGMEKGIQQGLEKGIQQGMEKGIQQGMERGIQQGLEKGREQERTTIAANCLKQGMSVKDIAAVTSLSVEEIQTLASKILNC